MNSSNLVATQQAFQISVMNDNETPTGIQGRFEIYRHAYYGRLQDSLRDNYPVLHLTLGDDDFDALALAYIQNHPSSYRSIRWFGEHIETFMRDHPEHLPHPALADLAKMEWHIRSMFDAPDSTYLTLADFQSLAPEAYANLQLQFIPAHTLCTLEWAIEPIWHELNEDPESASSAPEASPHTLLVWRKDLQTFWRTLDPEEAQLIQLTINDTNFGELCATFDDENTAASQAAAYLGRWVNEGLIANYLIA